MRSTIGGERTDALYADWSTTTAAIVWNATVNSDVQRTLGNGVAAQKIARLMPKTGLGTDNLAGGGADNGHFETGTGNDQSTAAIGSSKESARGPTRCRVRSRMSLARISRT